MINIPSDPLGDEYYANWNPSSEQEYKAQEQVAPMHDIYLEFAEWGLPRTEIDNILRQNGIGDPGSRAAWDHLSDLVRRDWYNQARAVYAASTPGERRELDEKAGGFLSKATWRNLPQHLQQRLRLAEPLSRYKIDKKSGRRIIPEGMVYRQGKFAFPTSVIQKTSGWGLTLEGKNIVTVPEGKISKRGQGLGAHPYVKVEGVPESPAFIPAGPASRGASYAQTFRVAMLVKGDPLGPGTALIDPRSFGDVVVGQKVVDVRPQKGKELIDAATVGQTWGIGERVQLAQGRTGFQHPILGHTVVGREDLPGGGYRYILDKFAAPDRIKFEQGGTKAMSQPMQWMFDEGITDIEGKKLPVQVVMGMKDFQGAVAGYYRGAGEDVLRADIARYRGTDVDPNEINLTNYSALGDEAMSAFVMSGKMDELLTTIRVPTRMTRANLERFREAGTVVEDSVRRLGENVYQANIEHQALVMPYGTQVSMYWPTRTFMSKENIERLRSQNPRLAERIEAEAAPTQARYRSIANAVLATTGRYEMPTGAVFAKDIPISAMWTGAEETVGGDQPDIRTVTRTFMQKLAESEFGSKYIIAGKAVLPPPQTMLAMRAEGEQQGQEISEYLHSARKLLTAVASGSQTNIDLAEAAFIRAQQGEQGVAMGRQIMRMMTGAELRNATGGVLTASLALDPNEIAVRDMGGGLGAILIREPLTDPKQMSLNVRTLSRKEMELRGMTPRDIVVSPELIQAAKGDFDGDLGIALSSGMLTMNDEGKIVTTTGAVLSTPEQILEAGRKAVSQGAGVVVDEIAGMGSRVTRAEARSILIDRFISRREISGSEIEREYAATQALKGRIGQYYNVHRGAQATMPEWAGDIQSKMWAMSHDPAQRPSKLSAGSNVFQSLATAKAHGKGYWSIQDNSPRRLGVGGIIGMQHTLFKELVKDVTKEGEFVYTPEEMDAMFRTTPTGGTIAAGVRALRAAPEDRSGNALANVLQSLPNPVEWGELSPTGSTLVPRAVAKSAAEGVSAAVMGFGLGPEGEAIKAKFLAMYDKQKAYIAATTGRGSKDITEFEAKISGAVSELGLQGIVSPKAPVLPSRPPGVASLPSRTRPLGGLQGALENRQSRTLARYGIRRRQTGRQRNLSFSEWKAAGGKTPAVGEDPWLNFLRGQEAATSIDLPPTNPASSVGTPSGELPPPPQPPTGPPLRFDAAGRAYRGDLPITQESLLRAQELVPQVQAAYPVVQDILDVAAEGNVVPAKQMQLLNSFKARLGKVRRMSWRVPSGSISPAGEDAFKSLIGSVAHMWEEERLPGRIEAEETKGLIAGATKLTESFNRLNKLVQANIGAYEKMAPVMEELSTKIQSGADLSKYEKEQLAYGKSLHSLMSSAAAGGLVPDEILGRYTAAIAGAKLAPPPTPPSGIGGFLSKFAPSGKGIFSGDLGQMAWGLMNLQRVWRYTGGTATKAMGEYANYIGGQQQYMAALGIGGGIKGAPADILAGQAAMRRMSLGFGKAAWDTWGWIPKAIGQVDATMEPGALQQIGTFIGPAAGATITTALAGNIAGRLGYGALAGGMGLAATGLGAATAGLGAVQAGGLAAGPVSAGFYGGERPGGFADVPWVIGRSFASMLGGEPLTSGIQPYESKGIWDTISDISAASTGVGGIAAAKTAQTLYGIQNKLDWGGKGGFIGDFGRTIAGSGAKSAADYARLVAVDMGTITETLDQIGEPPRETLSPAQQAYQDAVNKLSRDGGILPETAQAAVYSYSQATGRLPEKWAPADERAALEFSRLTSGVQGEVTRGFGTYAQARGLQYGTDAYQRAFTGYQDMEPQPRRRITEVSGMLAPAAQFARGFGAQIGFDVEGMDYVEAAGISREFQRFQGGDKQWWSQVGAFGGEVPGMGISIGTMPQMITRGPGGMGIGTTVPVPRYMPSGQFINQAQFQQQWGQSQRRLDVARATGDWVGGATAPPGMLGAAPVSVGGWDPGSAWGMQDAMNQSAANWARTQAGFQMQGIQSQKQYLWGSGTWDKPQEGSYWALQDRLRDLQKEQADKARSSALERQKASAGLSLTQTLESIGLSRKRFGVTQDYTAMAFARQQRQLGVSEERQQEVFGWQMADIGKKQRISGREFGWQMEDIEEAMRYASGRERRHLVTQRERMVVRRGEAVDTESEEEERLKKRDEWRRQDFEERREQIAELMAKNRDLASIQEEQFDMQERHARERYALIMGFTEDEEEAIKEIEEINDLIRTKNHEHAAENLERQEAQAGAAAARAEETRRESENWSNIQRSMSAVGKTFSEEIVEAFEKIFKIVRENEPDIERRRYVQPRYNTGSVPYPTGSEGRRGWQ